MAQQTFTKNKLSASTNGRGIKVVATSSTGTTIHTSVSGTSSWDEIWLYAYNGHTANVVLTIEFGGTTVPDDNIVLTIPFQQGLYLAVDGHILDNGAVITAFAATTNVIVIHGFVNQIV